MTTLDKKAKALLRPLYRMLMIRIPDITIRHPLTQHPFRLHPYMHQYFWRHGARREQTTMELFAKLINNGDVVVDIGGHIGFVADYFSHLVGAQGRVIVFEPGINNLPYLRQNMVKQPNVTVIEKAVGFNEGEFPLYLQSDSALGGDVNTLVKNFSQYLNSELNFDVTYRRTIMVPVVRLDSMLQTIPTVNFVKIDVEGAEVDVLNGGRELIQQHHPMLMVACHNTAPALWDVLNGAGYWMFTDEKKRIHDAGVLAHANYFCLHPHWHAAPLQAHFGIVES